MFHELKLKIPEMFRKQKTYFSQMLYVPVRERFSFTKRIHPPDRCGISKKLIRKHDHYTSAPCAGDKRPLKCAVVSHNTMLLPTPVDAGPIVRRHMGLPIMAGCDTTWFRTRDCSDTSCTEMQCLRLLHHLGACLSVQLENIQVFI